MKDLLLYAGVTWSMAGSFLHDMRPQLEYTSNCMVLLGVTALMAYAIIAMSNHK